MRAEAEIAATAKEGALRHEQAAVAVAIAIAVGVERLLGEVDTSQDTLRDERRRLKDSYKHRKK